MPRLRDLDLAKVSFYVVSTTAVVGSAFLFGLYSGASESTAFQIVERARLTVTEAFATARVDASTLTGMHPKHLLQPARRAGNGVTVNERHGEGLVFLSGFFGDASELRLIHRDGRIVNRWPARFSTLFPDTSHIKDRQPPATDWNVDTHGALALPDGSVVFNFEWGGLAKLDRCGKIMWTLRQQTHHSVERAERGGFWVPGRRYYPKGTETPFYPFTAPLQEDTLLRVSEDGRVVTEISVPGVLYANGLEGIVTTKVRRELVHVNKIEELTSDLASRFPQFKAGDLAISDVIHNLVFVLDPVTERVKWWRIGPWLRQHDPEFTSRGTIVVFNNNNYVIPADTASPSSAKKRPSQIVELNPSTHEYRVLYGGTENQPLLSVIRGKVDVTDRGGLLVTEFEGGRVFEADEGGRILWEYINRYDEDEVAEITEARLYPHSYFTVTDWSCN